MLYVSYHAHKLPANRHKEHQMEMEDELGLKTSSIHHSNGPSLSVSQKHGWMSNNRSAHTHTYFHSECFTLRVFLITEGRDITIVCSVQQAGTDVDQRRWMENNPEYSLSSSERESRCECRRRRGRANERTNEWTNATPHSTDCQKSHVSMVKMSLNTVRKRLLTLSTPVLYF